MPPNTSGSDGNETTQTHTAPVVFWQFVIHHLGPRWWHVPRETRIRILNQALAEYDLVMLDGSLLQGAPEDFIAWQLAYA